MSPQIYLHNEKASKVVCNNLCQYFVASVLGAVIYDDRNTVYKHLTKTKVLDNHRKINDHHYHPSFNTLLLYVVQMLILPLLTRSLYKLL